MAKGNSILNVGKDLFAKDDDKLFSRMLSKERYNSSKQRGDASFRVLYYGGATGTVPFMWESQPGTPKHKLNDHPPPPLTPPPYYQSTPRAINPTTLHKKGSKNSKILNSIFLKNPSKKINASPLFSPHSSSSSSFSSSYSLPSTPVKARKDENKSNSTKARSRSTGGVQYGVDEDEYGVGKYSPTSTLCFGPRNGSPGRRIKGMKSVKKVVLSIVGHAN